MITIFLKNRKTSKPTLSFSTAILSLTSFILIGFSAISQNIGINPSGALPDASALLDLESNDKGLLVPRLTTSERDAIQNPAMSLLIFNTESECFEAWNSNTSNWVSFGCIGCYLPTVPIANVGTNINSTDFDANWSASSGVTDYYLDVATDSTFTNFIINNQNVGNVTTYNVTGLTCETDYYYRVRAENICGTTISSNVEKVTVGSCCPGNITSIAAPVLSRTWSGTQGNWMEDPLEILGAGKIWVIPGYNNSDIYLYNSISDLANNNIASQWTLPYANAGTGAVVWGGFLYYNKNGGNNMIKYDLSNNTVVLDVPLAGAGFMNTYDYQWGGFSDIDFAVDETDLWVLYSTSSNSGKLVVSKLNPSDLSVIQTWNTNSESKVDMGNAFVVCGTVYCIDNYNGSTTINYKYDTHTSSGSSTSISFLQPGGYNSMVDYNPRNQMLYSWDDGRLQRYTITF